MFSDPEDSGTLGSVWGALLPPLPQDSREEEDEEEGKETEAAVVAEGVDQQAEEGEHHPWDQGAQDPSQDSALPLAAEEDAEDGDGGSELPAVGAPPRAARVRRLGASLAGIPGRLRLLGARRPPPWSANGDDGVPSSRFSQCPRCGAWDLLVPNVGMCPRCKVAVESFDDSSSASTSGAAKASAARRATARVAAVTRAIPRPPVAAVARAVPRPPAGWRSRLPPITPGAPSQWCASWAARRAAGGESDKDEEDPCRLALSAPRAPAAPELPPLAPIREFPLGLVDYSVRGVARHPSCCFVTGLGILAIIIAVGLTSISVEIDTSFDTFLKTDVESLIRYDAFEEAMKFTGAVKRRRLIVNFLRPTNEDNTTRGPEDNTTSGPTTTHRRVPSSTTTSTTLVPTPPPSGWVMKDLFIMYELADAALPGGLLHQKALHQINQFERRLKSQPGWLELCGQAEYESQRLCDPGISVVGYARPTLQIREDGTAAEMISADGRGQEFLPLPAVVMLLEKHGLDQVVWPFNVTKTATTTTRLRSSFHFKLGYSSAEPRHKVTGRWKSFLSDVVMPQCAIGFLPTVTWGAEMLCLESEKCGGIRHVLCLPEIP